MYECPVCKLDPTSHSLSTIYESDDIICYYTCPSKASKYDDRDGILQHYDGVLTDKGNKAWIWVFDCVNFGMNHATEFRLAIDMAKLITKTHGDTLTQIHIINPTIYIKITINVIWPFLSDHIKSIIVYDSFDV
jgi:hypothetical protein